MSIHYDTCIDSNCERKKCVDRRNPPAQSIWDELSSKVHSPSIRSENNWHDKYVERAITRGRALEKVYDAAEKDFDEGMCGDNTSDVLQEFERAVKSE